jgi:hypothetical protein
LQARGDAGLLVGREGKAMPQTADGRKFVWATDAKGRRFRRFLELDDRFELDDAGNIVKARDTVSGAPAAPAHWPADEKAETVITSDESGEPVQ